MIRSRSGSPGRAFMDPLTPRGSSAGSGSVARRHWNQPSNLSRSIPTSPELRSEVEQGPPHRLLYPPEPRQDGEGVGVSREDSSVFVLLAQPLPQHRPTVGPVGSQAHPRID